MRMPPCQHSLETAAGRFYQETKVNVYDHEYGKKKPGSDMDEICKMYSAGPEDLPDDYQFGEHQGPSGDKKKWHENIDHHDVGDPLHRIELSFLRDRERRFLALEYAGNVISELLDKLAFRFFPLEPVKFTVGSEQVSEEDDPVIEEQDHTAYIVKGHGQVKPDHCQIPGNILHTEACDDQTKEQKGIDHMPYPDPYWVQIHLSINYFFCLTFLKTV